MGHVRLATSLRCSKCHEKNWREDDRSWNNVEIKRVAGEGFICRCRTCNHEYYSNSHAARSLAGESVAL